MGFNALSKTLLTSGLILLLSACASNDGKDSRVVISAGDSIIPLNDIQYQLPFVVQVADLDGGPAANISVSLKVKVISYSKGSYTHTDLDGDGTTDEWVRSESASCSAEDANNNGSLDAGEDANGNGLLDPKTPTLTQHDSETPTLIPGTSQLVTDSNGFGYFTLTYPKTQGSWVTVQIIATAEDGLAENRAIDEQRLYVALNDLKPKDDPPAFVVSPYGTSGSCADTL